MFTTQVPKPMPTMCGESGCAGVRRFWRSPASPRSCQCIISRLSGRGRWGPRGCPSRGGPPPLLYRNATGDGRRALFDEPSTLPFIAEPEGSRHTRFLDGRRVVELRHAQLFGPMPDGICFLRARRVKVRQLFGLSATVWLPRSYGTSPHSTPGAPSSRDRPRLLTTSSLARTGAAAAVA